MSNPDPRAHPHKSRRKWPFAATLGVSLGVSALLWWAGLLAFGQAWRIVRDAARDVGFDAPALTAWLWIAAAIAFIAGHALDHLGWRAIAADRSGVAHRKAGAGFVFAAALLAAAAAGAFAASSIGSVW